MYDPFNQDADFPNLYPIFLKLDGQPVLVVGAGKIALRKITMLVDCDASVTVVAPEVLPELEKMAEDNWIALARRTFEPDDVEGAKLVVAATSDREINSAVTQAARSKGIWVNAVDMPDLCDFYVPSVVDRAPLKIAINSSGASPSLSQAIRKKLEVSYPESIAEYVEFVGSRREELKRLAPDKVPEWGQAIAGGMGLDKWLAGNIDEAQDELQELFEKLRQEGSTE